MAYAQNSSPSPSLLDPPPQDQGPAPQCHTADPGVALTSNQFARQVIRRLLDGADPGTFATVPACSYGPWAEVVGLLLGAHANGESAGTGGAAAVRTVYGSLVRMDEKLMLLMAADDTPPRTSYTIGELLAANFPALKFIIAGLLPIGLSILAGRPKEGKSLLVLQLTLAAYLGATFLGLQAPRLKILYLALEDTPYRIADRLRKLARGMGIDLAACVPLPQGGDGDPGGIRYGDVTIVTAWSYLSDHGMADLRTAMDRERYDLVIIDTFSRILGRGDQMDQQEMTQTMASLQRLALDHAAAILLVDHHRKSARTSLDADPIDDIMGSTAKAGVVDCAMGLYRRHNQDEATLKLCGRDFGDSELALTWDPDAFCWNLKPPKAKSPRPVPAPRITYTLREQETIDAVAEISRRVRVRRGDADPARRAHRPQQRQPVRAPPGPGRAWGAAGLPDRPRAGLQRRQWAG